MIILKSPFKTFGIVVFFVEPSAESDVFTYADFTAIGDVVDDPDIPLFEDVFCLSSGAL